MWKIDDSMETQNNKFIKTQIINGMGTINEVSREDNKTICKRQQL